jgi:hypothetical protein
LPPKKSESFTLAFINVGLRHPNSFSYLLDLMDILH